MTDHQLLICTIGGSPEPVLQSILHIAPDRVIFLCSDESSATVEQVKDQLADYERPLHEGAFDIKTLADPQSLVQCVKEMRPLRFEVEQWTQRGDSHLVLVDFTAGTKIMSAALALVAHRWPCRFIYVGGTQRDKNGLGVVCSGTETVIPSDNPWDALAYQPIQDAAHLFNHNQPAAAVATLQPHIQNIADPAVKRQIIAVKHLADAYAKWDAFQHHAATAAFDNCLKASNDLDAALPGHRLTPILQQHHRLCRQLADKPGQPSENLILDLLANALRRAGDGRYDDATARLYRATEALAQLALKVDFQIESDQCPLDKIPHALRRLWEPRTVNGNVKLGLQDDYNLLAQLDHPLGRKFRTLHLHDNQKSPLVSRNQSILAHGFAPTTERAFQALWDKIFQLADNPHLQPFHFPQLPLP